MTSRRGTILLALSVPAILAAAAGVSVLRTRDAPRRGAPPEWGIYQIYWSGREYPRILEEALAPFASRPSFVMFYRDLGRLVFPARGVAAIRAAGATPVISLELWEWHRKGRRLISDLVAGAYDDALQKWAADARQEGGRVLLRFGFEMNGDWFTWSGDPEAFREAWRRARAIFVEEGADNVEWVWAPNIQSVPDVPENDMHLYYPGDDVVDWVALDGYNFGDHHDEWHRWQSFEEVFAGVLDDLESRYPGKPVMIAETGSAPGEPGAKARWYREAWAYLAKHPRVRAVVWFNLDKRREGEPDWRITTCEDSLEAFNETFAAPRK